MCLGFMAIGKAESDESQVRTDVCSRTHLCVVEERQNFLNLWIKWMTRRAGLLSPWGERCTGLGDQAHLDLHLISISYGLDDHHVFSLRFPLCKER